jgi:hypothetical protein
MKLIFFNIYYMVKREYWRIFFHLEYVELTFSILINYSVGKR